MENIAEFVMARAKVIKYHGVKAARYAVVVGGKVTSVVKWDPNDQPDWRPIEGNLVACGDDVGPGFVYGKEGFSNPNEKARATISLADAKAKRLSLLDLAFTRSSTGLFITPQIYEEMKAAAMSAAAAIKSAKTLAEATQAYESAIVQLTIARAQAAQ